VFALTFATTNSTAPFADDEVKASLAPSGYQLGPAMLPSVCAIL
jgi:hypothetical protein